MLRRKARREGFGLRVEDEVDVALTVERHVLRAMLRHRRKTHDLEQTVELVRVRMAELDELEAVRPHRVLVRDRGRRCVVGEGTHGGSPLIGASAASPFPGITR
jgi:hypothetical protein